MRCRASSPHSAEPHHKALEAIQASSATAPRTIASAYLRTYPSGPAGARHRWHASTGPHRSRLRRSPGSLDYRCRRTRRSASAAVRSGVVRVVDVARHAEAGGSRAGCSSRPATAATPPASPASANAASAMEASTSSRPTGWAGTDWWPNTGDEPALRNAQRVERQVDATAEARQAPTAPRAGTPSSSPGFVRNALAFVTTPPCAASPCAARSPCAASPGRATAVATGRPPRRRGSTQPPM